MRGRIASSTKLRLAPPNVRRSPTGAIVAAATAVQLACAGANPAFDAAVSGEAAESSGTTAHATIADATGGSSGGAADRGGTGSDTGLQKRSLFVFASPSTNGSVEGDGEPGIEQANVSCEALATRSPDAPCSEVARAFLFEDPIGSVELRADALGFLLEAPVIAADEVVVAASLEQFVTGPLELSLAAAGVVAPGVDRVWTGLNPAAAENCSAWTSGNDQREGGAGSTDGGVGWAGAHAASCGDEMPFLCLCE